MDCEDVFVENLIENVKKQKCLYDKNDDFYYNKSVRDRAWSEVSEMCGRSAADCRHRWKLLRERFVKNIKRLDVSSDSDMCYAKEWKFLQPLMFLKDYFVPRRTSDNLAEDVKSVFDHSLLRGDSSQDTPTPTPLPKKKAKTNLHSLYQKFEKMIEQIEKTLPSTEANPLDESFLSIASCLMKELPEDVKEEFQARMIQELYRLRLENKF